MDKTFDQQGRNDLITYDNFWKISTGDDYRTGCLLDYNYCKKYKIIAIDLSKQQAQAKTMQQINFTGNLAWERNANAAAVFLIEEAKEADLEFSKGTVKVLWIFL